MKSTPTIEHAVLIYIIAAGHYLETIEAGLTNKHFVSSPREWSFLRTYFDKYRTTPTIAAFVEKFPDFQYFSWDITDYDFVKLFRELNEQLLNRRILSLLNDSVETFQNDGALPALDFISGQIREIQMAHRKDTDLDLASDFAFRLADQERRQTLRRSGMSPGVSTGIVSLDALTGGWSPGNLNIVLGKTGIGKSFLLLLFAYEAWRKSKSVLYINLEMSPIEVAYRFDAFAFRISNTSLYMGDISLEHYETKLQESINKTPFILCGQRHGGSFTPAIVDAKIKRYEPRIVLIDYITLMKSDRHYEKDYQEMDNVCRDLKTLAEVYQVPIIAVAQTHRPAADKRSIDLEDVATSYAMMQHADIVLTVDRPTREEKILKLKLRKKRTLGGLGGIIRLSFNVDVGDMHEIMPEGDILDL